MPTSPVSFYNTGHPSNRITTIQRWVRNGQDQTGRSRRGSAGVHFILVPRVFPGRRSGVACEASRISWRWSCYAKRAAKPRGIFNSSGRSAAKTALPRCSRQLRRLIPSGLILWKRFGQTPDSSKG